MPLNHFSHAPRPRFSSGYQSILFVAAGITLTASVLAWLLVRSADTAPTSRHVKAQTLSSPQAE
jgi:hypothetical protein